jgi:hypothetical protein
MRKKKKRKKYNNKKKKERKKEREIWEKEKWVCVKIKIKWTPRFSKVH